jgi:hypothetical protein
VSIESGTSVIQSYFDGSYEGDGEKLARAFHPTRVADGA